MYPKPARILASVLLLAILATAAQAQDAAPVVNVNAATLEELTYLPGIGEATADNIMYAREIGVRFEKPADLLRVHGIGEKRLEAIKRYVVFTGATTATAPIGTSTAKPRKIRRPKEDAVA